uniref:COP9 signalosome complex subunit 9 n=1 Tax=Vombatus ursinus TaxID=29139 RepID=A0A4X2LZ22_VOMUR
MFWTKWGRPYSDKAGGSQEPWMDLASNEKTVYIDFFSDIEDLFDDDDMQ